MIKGILFDLDDTLIPSIALYEIALRTAWRCFRRYRPMAWPEFSRRYQRARHEVKSRLGRMPSSRNRLLYFKSMVEEAWGRPRPAVALALDDAYNTCWKRIRPESVRKLAAGLSRDYVLGIVTNQIARMQLQKMSRLDPEGRLFKVLLTSEEMGFEKPDKRIFLEACRRMRCRPQQTLLVGNSREDDVDGGHQAGLHVAYWHPAPLRGKLPSHVYRVKNGADIVNLLRHLAVSK